MRADELFGGYKWYFNDAALKGDSASLPWMTCAEERVNLLRPGVLGGIVPAEYIRKTRAELLDGVPTLESDDEANVRRREMFYLNYYGFMQTLTERNTAMSSAHKLKVIAPFATPEIAEYAFNIPWKLKSYNGREKGLLRYAFSDVLPKSVAWRMKSPFPKTHNPQYMRLVSSKLRETLAAPDCRLTQIYDRAKLESLIDSGGQSFRKNWFGQLMTVPQTFAYLLQLECWLREFDVEIVV